MNFDNRILSFYKEIQEINKGKFPYPRFMILYPTNMCQFNCTFCDYKELNSCKPKELKEYEWKHILSTFKNNGGEAVELSGGGEPLMLSTIEEFLIYAKEIGLAIGIITNGLNIDKHKRNKLYNLLLDACTYIRVSFESGSSEIFKAIKGKDCFSRILNNVGELIQDKPKDLQVSYKYTIPSSYSLDDIYNAIELADDMYFDSIQFKAVCNSDENLRDKDRKLIEDEINGVKKYIWDMETKIICNLERYEKKSNGCKICSIQTLIDYNGDVFACCYYNHRINEHKLCNIFETDFEKIWGSHKHAEKLKEIDRHKCNLYDCRYERYDYIMKDLMKTNYLSFI